MTPEEHTAQVLLIYRREAGGEPALPARLGRLISDAIRAAVEAEREACALIADKHEREWRALIIPGDNELGVSTAYNSASEAWAIAIDIRARGKEL